jgi:hypothetical protein
MIEVPGHWYVLGDTYTCHRYFCYAYHFFTHIGCTLLTCDMYMCRLRHIHDPVFLSLKMEGIRLLFSYILFCFISISRSTSLWAVCSVSNFCLFNLYLYYFFYVLSIKCSSSGGIRDTCSTRCENWVSKITMYNSAERSQMQQCNNTRYTQFPLLRNARTYEWVWQKSVTSELRYGERPWGNNAA